MDKEIAKFTKNATEEVIVRIVEYKGKDLVDIRAYVKPLISDEGLKATRKGICVRLEQLPELINALKAAEKESKKIKDARSGEINPN